MQAQSQCKQMLPKSLSRTGAQSSTVGHRRSPPKKLKGAGASLVAGSGAATLGSGAMSLDSGITMVASGVTAGSACGSSGLPASPLDSGAFWPPACK
jgi:hypothetical protein